MCKGSRIARASSTRTRREQSHHHRRRRPDGHRNPVSGPSIARRSLGRDFAKGKRTLGSVTSNSKVVCSKPTIKRHERGKDCTDARYHCSGGSAWESVVEYAFEREKVAFRSGPRLLSSHIMFVFAALLLSGCGSKNQDVLNHVNVDENLAVMDANASTNAILAGNHPDENSSAAQTGEKPTAELRGADGQSSQLRPAARHAFSDRAYATDMNQSSSAGAPSRPDDNSAPADDRDDNSAPDDGNGADNSVIE